MSDWKSCSIGELILDIGDGGTPSRAIKENFGGDIPWVVIDDIQHEIWETNETLSQQGFQRSSAKLWQKDSIVLSTGATIGEVGIARVPLTTKQGISGIVCSPKLLPEFFYYKLQSLKAYLNSIAQGSTIREVRPPLIKKIKIDIPTLIEEQRAIADILSTLDEAIAQSESLVRKYQSIKQGLMSDLLTRGVDENGEVSETKDLVETQIGSFPKTWIITSLGELISKNGGFIQTGPFGSQLHSYEYVEQGVPVIMPQDIMEDGKISEDNITRITTEKVKELSRHIVKPNDVVFARRGDLSRCSAITEYEAGWLCGTGSMLVRPSPKEIAGRWLAAVYRHEIGQHQIRARAVGSIMVNLNSTLLRDLVIPKPPLHEQAVIMEIIETQDNLLSAEVDNLAKLRLLKHGLMQDLLSGQVRVKLTDE